MTQTKEAPVSDPLPLPELLALLSDPSLADRLEGEQRELTAALDADLAEQQRLARRIDASRGRLEQLDRLRRLLAPPQTSGGATAEPWTAKPAGATAAATPVVPPAPIDVERPPGGGGRTFKRSPTVTVELRDDERPAPVKPDLASLQRPGEPPPASCGPLFAGLDAPAPSGPATPEAEAPARECGEHAILCDLGIPVEAIDALARHEITAVGELIDYLDEAEADSDSAALEKLSHWPDHAAAVRVAKALSDYCFRHGLPLPMPRRAVKEEAPAPRSITREVNLADTGRTPKELGDSYFTAALAAGKRPTVRAVAVAERLYACCAEDGAAWEMVPVYLDLKVYEQQHGERHPLRDRPGSDAPLGADWYAGVRVKVGRKDACLGPDCEGLRVLKGGAP